MMNLLVAAGAALTLALPSQQQRVDTTLAVRQGASLTVDARQGSVSVSTWDRDAVRVVAAIGRGGRSARGPAVEVRGSPGAVRVGTAGHAHNTRVDYQLFVPRWIDLRVDAQNASVQIDGVEGEVAVGTVQGAVQVRGGRNYVGVTSVGGSIQIAGVRGRVEAETVNQGIRVSDVRGDVSVETTNGGIVLEGVTGSSVRAETVNGGIRYQGSLADGGFYRFASHNGSVIVTVPGPPDARVSVMTYNGNFESEFPLQLTSMQQSRTFNFTIGTGSARLEMESFNGTVRLVRQQ
ncbi:MAG: DUF4097 family beta strand repeat-containing protein [Longimicrobiales bacterium]